MNRFSSAVVASGLVIGLLSERQAYGWHQPLLWVPDLGVGLVWVACAASTWPRHRAVSGLSGAFALAWFAAGFAPDLTYGHRGPLLHLLIAYPALRPRTRVGGAAVLAGYVLAAVWPFWLAEWSGVVLAAGLVAAVVIERRAVRGWSLHRRRPALPAAVALGAVLVGGAVARWAVPSRDGVVPALVSYDVTLMAIALMLVWPLLRRREAAVADLVVELSESRERPIRDELARVLGDPDLHVGFWQPERAEYATVDGTTLQPPSPGDGRAITHIDQDGEPFVVLVHDRALTGDPSIGEALSAATRLRAANVALRRAVLAQIDELTASRRRLVVAASAERERLQIRLEHGAERRISEVLSALDQEAQGDQQLRKAVTQLRHTIDDLHEIAAGLHPRELSNGLGPALAALADRCPTTVQLAVTPGRFAIEVEVAIYFACAEALANVAKHAAAAHAEVTVTAADGWVDLTVSDDGRGGADPGRGSGLTGIADRVEALGGSVDVASCAAGTTLTARLPTAVNRSSGTAWSQRRP